MSCNWLVTRIWLIVIILTTSLIGMPVHAQGTTVVRVDPPTLSAQVNDTSSVSIKVDNISNLTAFELHLSFNPGVLEVTGMTNGGFVAADFTAQNTFDNGAGTIDYAVAQMNRAPAQGSGTLLTIAFRAKAAGSSQVTTRSTPAAPGGLLLSDQNGSAIPASWQPGTINVGTSTSPTSTSTSTSTLPSVNTSTPTSTSTLPSANTSTPTNTATLSSGNTSTPTSTPTKTPTLSSGNTSTPTKTPAPTAPPLPPSGTLGIHTVRFGEWLYCIGRAYGVTPGAIIEANNIWWPYIIFPYQKLTIPNVPWTNIPAGRVCQAQFSVTAPPPVPTSSPVTATPVTATPVPATTTPITATFSPATATPIPPTTVPSTTCREIYVVRPGNTLFRIALWYGTSYDELARVNNISNPRLIYPGQQLCIP